MNEDRERLNLIKDQIEEEMDVEDFLVYFLMFNTLIVIILIVSSFCIIAAGLL